jgi:hypothetical protein
LLLNLTLGFAIKGAFKGGFVYNHPWIRHIHRGVGAATLASGILNGYFGIERIGLSATWGYYYGKHPQLGQLITTSPVADMISSSTPSKLAGCAVLCIVYYAILVYFKLPRRIIDRVFKAMRGVVTESPISEYLLNQTLAPTKAGRWETIALTWVEFRDRVENHGVMWVTLENKYILDVSMFAAFHPGGLQTILENVGTDITDRKLNCISNQVGQA